MLYIVGDNPYYSCSRSEESGAEWRFDADDMQKALEHMLGSMVFPGEAIGRYDHTFIPGVSLPYPEDEVIQVWTEELEAVKRMEKYCDRAPHSGNGTSMGVVAEIHVSDLHKYVHPVRKLLVAAVQEETPFSPVGASMINFSQKRKEIQRSMLINQYAVSVKRHDMETLTEQFKDQQHKMESGLEMLNTYLHGASQTVRLHRGDVAPHAERWRIFQNRQFLNKEIAVLGNFDDFGFENIEALDTWLVKSGRIWKFLPFAKTILVTRMRDKEKNYGDPWANVFKNQFNYQNILWIRNGQNVTRVNVRNDFDNAVFPDPAQEQKVLAVVEESIWNCYFAKERRTRWGTMLDRAKEESPGLRAKPEKEKEPYNVRQITQNRFTTMEAWKSSEEYRAMMPQMRQAVVDYLRDKNKKQMGFLMLLQGIVDHTKLLDVPPGTDLFSSELCSRYFELLHEYSHGLPDHTYSNQMVEYMTRVRKGDWIIIPYFCPHNSEGRAAAVKLTLCYVCRLKDGVPVVKHRPYSKRRSHETWTCELLKNPRSYVLKDVPFLRTDIPAKLAEAILDDREWKLKHTWVVPLLARWAEVQKKFLLKKTNDTCIEFENEHRPYSHRA